MPSSLWRTLLVGVISTLSMDVLSAVAYRLRLTAPLSPHLIGRWFAYLFRGHPFQADIAAAHAVRHELALAVPVHYAIGLSLAALYVWSMLQLGWSPRNVWFALAFGLCTNVLPWLLMFPAMGYGFFGTHGPAGTRLFISSLLSHAFFGLGIWIGVTVMGIPSHVT